MKASVIQSLMARNRHMIRICEEFAASYKYEADAYFEEGVLEEAHWMVKFYRQEKAEIAKLVAIQKELKKALREAYAAEKCEAEDYIPVWVHKDDLKEMLYAHE